MGVELKEAWQWFPEFCHYLASGGELQPPELAAELVICVAGKADALSGCYLSVGEDMAELVSHAEEIQANRWHRLGLRLPE